MFSNYTATLIKVLNIKEVFRLYDTLCSNLVPVDQIERLEPAIMEYMSLLIAPNTENDTEGIVHLLESVHQVSDTIYHMHSNTLSRLVTSDDLKLDEHQIVTLVVECCKQRDTQNINTTQKKNENKCRFPSIMQYADKIRCDGGLFEV